MKLLQNSNFIALSLFLIFSVVATNDLTRPGLYTSHDGETHTARIAQYYLAIKDGQIPPRFAGEFYNRFESPIFVYVYPFPYFLGALIHLIGFSFANSFKIEMALSFIFSGVFAYLWLKEYFKSSQAAFLGSMLYAWSPYRFSLIYVRGSLSEALAYTFVPLSLYFITKLRKNNSFKNLALASVSLSLVLLSQNLVALMFIPVFLMYVLLLAFEDGSNKTFVFKSVLVFIWSFAISSITYIPSLFERKYIVFDQVFQLLYDSHFVTLRQLVRSPWGYGFDLSGTVNDQLSFELGITHWLVIILFMLMILYISLRTKLNIKRLLSQKVIPYALIIPIIAAIIFLTLENPSNRIVWKLFTPLRLIDIPWRLLGLIPILVAFMAAFLASRIRSGFFLILVIGLLIFSNRNHIRINKQLPLNDDNFLHYFGSATQYSEFTPTTRGSTDAPLFTDKSIPVSTASGWAAFENITSNSRQVSFTTDIISENAQLRINKYYFPGVRLYLDGKSLEFKKSFNISSYTPPRLDSTKNTNGFIYLNVSQGKHYFRLIYGETKLRFLSDMLTLVASLVALTAIINFKRIRYYLYGDEIK